MKSIYYWSPCLNKVGTYKSTINSAISLSSYSKKKYKIKIINACGEWNDCKQIFNSKNIELIHLGFNYFKFLPKEGFLASRLSYIIILCTSIFPLIRLLKKDKPDFLVMHLITLLPILLAKYFNKSTNFILRISGYPKLNPFRKFFWKLLSNSVFKVTCPSIDLIHQLNEKKIFLNQKIHFLPDPILDIKDFAKKKWSSIKEYNLERKYFISVGRLTKQKNFGYLIDEFKKFKIRNPDYNLLIFGDGELRQKLQKKIDKENLKNHIFLMGYSNNIFKFMKNAEALLLSSLWEDPGFVIIEAAMSDLFIISSDCKNGPSEFLNFGKGGILFKSNQKGALEKSLNEFLIDKSKNQKKILTKKNCSKYTLFKHYNYFNKILLN